MMRASERSCCNCLKNESPPIKRAAFKLRFLPATCLIAVKTCWANSRVGTSTKAISVGLSKSLLTNGIAKANVLPVPVWADPRISFPASANGMVCA